MQIVQSGVCYGSSEHTKLGLGSWGGKSLSLPFFGGGLFRTLLFLDSGREIWGSDTLYSPMFVVCHMDKPGTVRYWSCVIWTVGHARSIHMLVVFVM